MTTDPPFGAYAPSLAARAAISAGRILPRGGFGLWLAGMVRGAAMSGLVEDTADIEALGLKFRLRPRANLSERRLYVTPHLLDPEELDLVRTVMGPGKLFLDVGANAGVYALVAAAAGGPDSKVLAVEPQSALCRRLAYNASINGLSNIDIAQVALSNHEGEARFQIDPKNAGRSRLGEEMLETDSEIVRVTTLRSLLVERAVERVDVMKIDVEGHEAVILRAFISDAPEEVRPGLILMERPDLNRLEGENALQVATAAGYRIKAETRMNVILESLR